MTIFPVDHNAIIIGTAQGSFHAYEEGGRMHLTMYDHFHVVVDGKHKQVPTVTIDSDEYPTRLVVEQTEAPWLGPCKPPEGEGK